MNDHMTTVCLDAL